MTEIIRLTVEDVTAPLATMLFHELDADLLSRYPVSSIHALIQNGEVRTVFLVAWHSEEPIGCAAMIDLGSGAAELKRMFVRTRFRNQGIARQLLAAIEKQARELGYTEIRLETGNRQPEAIGLYESSGYSVIAKYGSYPDDPSSVYYAKSLIAS
jgi:putative acetyltransferase